MVTSEFNLSREQEFVNQRHYVIRRKLRTFSFRYFKKRYNKKKKREEWFVEYSDETTSWEPKSSFLHIDEDSGEIVQNEKWNKFEQNLKGNTLNISSLTNNLVRGVTESEKEIEEPPETESEIMKFHKELADIHILTDKPCSNGFRCQTCHEYVLNELSNGRWVGCSRCHHVFWSPWYRKKCWCAKSKVQIYAHLPNTQR
jgi:hypothetical protein